MPGRRRRGTRHPRDPPVDVRCGAVRADGAHVAAAGMLGTVLNDVAVPVTLTVTVNFQLG